MLRCDVRSYETRIQVRCEIRCEVVAAKGCDATIVRDRASTLI